MFGLALGLASAILIFLYVSDELQYDTMHPQYQNTYRLGIKFTNRDGQVFNNTAAPGILTRQLLESRPEVTGIARVNYIGYPTSLHYKDDDKIILTEEIKWVEPNFDNVIAFDLVSGNREKIFENQNTMIISELGAKRLFGDEDPMGKVISVKHNLRPMARRSMLSLPVYFGISHRTHTLKPSIY
jgi:putative ABC transport system permease protein